MTAQRKLISIVVPFFNESEGVSEFYNALSIVCDNVDDIDFEFVCVDDGSHDDTLTKLAELAKQDSRIRIVELTRNFGKESALTAGIDFANGDAIIPMDADLQDPPNLIPELIDQWQKGAEVVLAQRSDRSSDFLLKRKTAESFYRFHNRLSDTRIPENVGDFRLMDRVVINALKQLPERQRFMKGLFAWVGFRTTVVSYTRNPRSAGKTTFSGWRLWNLALEAITSFSTAPLRVWTYIGITGAFLTFIYATFIIARTLIYGIDVPGYASLLVAVLFLGSLQLVGIGVLGEYIGRIYLESKQRPVYLVRKYHGEDLEP